MTEYPHLSNAPIVEALIDIQVQLPSSKSVNDFRLIFDKIKETYPKNKERRKFSGSFAIQGDKVKSDIQNNEIDGMIFLSEDNQKIIQSRLDGFSFHYKNIYTTWSDFSGEAKMLWDIYSNIAEPVAVKRIGLRYINKIYLKTPFDPLNYFKTLPTLSDDLNYGIFRLFSQISITNDNIKSYGVITQAIEDADENAMNFIFDIDVFKSGDFKLNEIWYNFDNLREFKNEIFFKSVTEKTLKLLS